jgi:hypothetical protein
MPARDIADTGMLRTASRYFATRMRTLFLQRMARGLALVSLCGVSSMKRIAIVYFADDITVASVSMVTVDSGDPVAPDAAEKFQAAVSASVKQHWSGAFSKAFAVFGTKAGTTLYFSACP